MRKAIASSLAQGGELRDQRLIFMNGYLNGLRGQKVWDEKVEGERVDKVLRECRAAPARPVLDVLTDVWPR